MAEAFKIEEIEEKVILVGVSEQDGDDAEDSVAELAELVKTAGATVVGTMIQKRELIHPGTYIGSGKVAELSCLWRNWAQPALCVMMNFHRRSSVIWKICWIQK